MSTELVVSGTTRDTDSWAPMLPSVKTLSEGICDTEFVPRALRGKAYAVAACVLTGRELGLGPMESLQKIYLVEGRPSLSAEVMRSLVLRAGHDLRFPVLTDREVKVEGRRAGGTDWTTLTWTIADAQRIGVANKDVWKKYPRTMLANRATAEICRLMFADALGGVSYTPDEVEEMESEGTPVQRTGARKARRSQAAPEPVEPPIEDTVPDDVVDAEVVDDDEPVIPAATPAQVQKLAILLAENGIEDRDARLAYISAQVNRTVTSSKDLDRAEASAVIAVLEAEA